MLGHNSKPSLWHNVVSMLGHNSKPPLRHNVVSMLGHNSKPPLRHNVVSMLGHSIVFLFWCPCKHNLFLRCTQVRGLAYMQYGAFSTLCGAVQGTLWTALDKVIHFLLCGSYEKLCTTDSVAYMSCHFSCMWQGHNWINYIVIKMSWMPIVKFKSIKN